MHNHYSKNVLLTLFGDLLINLDGKILLTWHLYLVMQTLGVLLNEIVISVYNIQDTYIFYSYTRFNK